MCGEYGTVLGLTDATGGATADMLREGCHRLGGWMDHDDDDQAAHVGAILSRSVCASDSRVRGGVERKGGLVNGSVARTCGGNLHASNTATVCDH